MTTTNNQSAFANGFKRALTGFTLFSRAAAFARRCRSLGRLSEAQLAALRGTRGRIAHHGQVREKGLD